MFFRNISEEDQSSAKAKGVLNKVAVRKAESEKTKLPRRIFKPTSKDIPCSALCKIPEEITVNKKFAFVGRSEVYFVKTPKHIRTLYNVFQIRGGSQGHISVRSEEGSSALLTSANSFCSTTTSLLDADSSSEDCKLYSQTSQNKMRLVSSSPAFQKFLKTHLDNHER